jgi:cellulose synthase/poly-beta-1,6-N-acetylglucosamine synthase-like glycosyltransferase
MTFEILLLGLVAVVLFQLIYYIFIFGKFSFVKTETLPKKNIPISVIVCAKNEAENIKKFVPLLLEQEYPTFELVLIDDASSDETRDLFESLEKKYRHKIMPIVVQDSKDPYLAEHLNRLSASKGKKNIVISGSGRGDYVVSRARDLAELMENQTLIHYSEN